MAAAIAEEEAREKEEREFNVTFDSALASSHGPVQVSDQ
jgi:hypothetical protein